MSSLLYSIVQLSQDKSEIIALHFHCNSNTFLQLYNHGLVSVFTSSFEKIKISSNVNLKDSSSTTFEFVLAEITK